MSDVFEDALARVEGRDLAAEAVAKMMAGRAEVRAAILTRVSAHFHRYGVHYERQLMSYANSYRDATLALVAFLLDKIEESQRPEQ